MVTDVALKPQLSPEALAERKKNQSRIGKSNVSRSKGHERRIANLLTEWTGTEFRRRRVEGRDTTVIERESTADVISVRGELIFSIEAKCGEPSSLDGLMANPAGNKLCEWWHQSSYDALLLTNVMKRTVYPLLFFKPHPNFDWLAVPKSVFTNGLLKRSKIHQLYTEVVGVGNVWFPHLEFNAFSYLGQISHNVTHTKNSKNKKFVPIKLDAIIICRWKDFSDYIDPNSIFVDGKIPPPPLEAAPTQI